MSMHHVSEFLKTDSYGSGEWQSFTLSVRRSKGNACEMCRRSDGILQVHHLFYEHGRKLWDYDHQDLVLLCRPCHKAVHEQLQAFRRFVFGKLRPETFRVINESLSVALSRYDPLVFVHALQEFVATPSMVDRYAKAFGMRATQSKLERKYTPEDEINRGRAALIDLETKARNWK